jgi:aspartyl-tRNA(Asn)/glutamyl-tRNA(Gln) amidotransferase subunit C
MKGFSTDDIRHLCGLSALKLSPRELKQIQAQLSETLVAVERLKKIDTSQLEETNQVTRLINIFRPDQPRPSQSQADALTNASATHRGFFKTQALFTGEK